jgi:N-acetylmuramoyl-L-alanine amidase
MQQGRIFMRRIHRIIIHCTATRPSQDIDAAEIRVWHVRDNGWRDIGYHYVIKRDGVLEEGRPLEQAGAHVSGHNADSIGICLVGGVAADGRTPESNFTPAQWTTLGKAVRGLLKTFPFATVHGHNEFAAKACPTFDVREWWATRQPLAGEA